MNAERLHVVAITLNEEMTKRDLVGKVNTLIAALQNVVNNPQAPHQQSLADSRKAVFSALVNTPSDSFSPAWRQLLSEMGGDGLFGSSLKETIEEIFNRNQITPAVALTELQEMNKKLQAFKKALEQLISSFAYFEIGAEELSPGECEIGMLIPRKEVNNSLLGFAKGLNDLSFILNTFSEVATGKVDELEIKTISSTDLMVYLGAIPAFAACVALAVERIVSLYKQFLEIRKLRAELEKHGVPGKHTLGIEEHANTVMEKGIIELSQEIMDKFYKGPDKGRKNELRNQIQIVLNRLANRIDHGYNIEVRVKPLEKVEQENESTKDATENINIIMAALKNMQFMKLEGAPILQLPEGKEKSEEKIKAGEGRKK